MSMPSRIIAASALAAVLAATPARAHEGGIDLRGEVVSADAKHVTIRSGDGRQQTFTLTAQTRITLEGVMGRPADVTPGLRAVVHGKRIDGAVVATSVQLASAGAPGGTQRPSPSGS